MPFIPGARATPAAASANPTHACGGMASPSASQPMTAASGGTRKKSGAIRGTGPSKEEGVAMWRAEALTEGA